MMFKYNNKICVMPIIFSEDDHNNMVGIISYSPLKLLTKKPTGYASHFEQDTGGYYV